VKGSFEMYWSMREDSPLRSVQFGGHEQKTAAKNGRA
jgi:hypothetical protein